jgi:hypothetical protein
MLFVHEVHEVVGRSGDEFEALIRDEWLGSLAETPGARLLWFGHQAHGTGPAYAVVTMTALADHDTWSVVDDRVRSGDLRTLHRAVDAVRRRSTAKVLRPTRWSPLTTVDLEEIPTEPVARELRDHVLYMEDTAWPRAGEFEAYLDRAETLYLPTLERAAEHDMNLLELVAGFTPAWGSGRSREVVLWQRIVRPELLLPLLTREIPPEHRVPGTWMHDALEMRDQWESRLLRMASWSPLT